MSKFVAYTLWSGLTLSLAFANSISAETTEMSHSVLIPTEIQLPGLDVSAVDAEKKVPRKSPVVKALFSPFTGKISGEKVRMRLQPDLSGQVASELSKGDVISVLAQEGDFYKIKPPHSFKTYVFRSFVIDNVVEANRVNVRLGPDLESPVVGYLNAGDKVEPIETQNSSHKKWLAIAPPENASFYIAKNFVENIGDLAIRSQLEGGKAAASEALSKAETLFSSEIAKPFEEINFTLVKETYEKVSKSFPEQKELVKAALAKAEDLYGKKKIAFFETKGVTSLAELPVTPETQSSLLSGLSHWRSVEHALYTAWAQAHEEQGEDSFYENERLAALKITGIVEPIKASLKNKPGDFVVKHNALPVGYVYSTNVNLEDYVGKQVTLLVSPRPNHNFAFPAYYAHQVE